MSRNLRAALLAAIEQDEHAERAENDRVREANMQADEMRRATREERDSRSLEVLAHAFTRIADELNKIAACGIRVQQ